MLKQVPGLSFSVLSATLSHLRISSRAIRSLRSSAFLFVPRSLRLCQVDCATVTAGNLCVCERLYVQSCQCDSDIMHIKTIEILYLIRMLSPGLKCLVIIIYPLTDRLCVQSA